MSQPANAAPAIASAEEVVIDVLKSNGLETIAGFDPVKQIFPDIAPMTPPALYCTYKRLTTRGKRRIGALSPGGPQWITLEMLCCCSADDAKRGRSRSLADAVQAALEAVSYPAIIKDRKVASIKCRESRSDLMGANANGEMLPDRVVRLEISVKLN